MRLTRKSTQATLFGGEFVPTFPKVRTSRGFLLDWDRNRIVRQILEETRLVETFYGYEGGADEETAKDIARRVEKKIQMLGLQSLSGPPLIREIVNMTLLERGLVPPYRNVCTRVGTPVFDAHLIDVGRGFEAHDNANLQENAETSHKKKADKISKEQYLLQLPPRTLRTTTSAAISTSTTWNTLVLARSVSTGARLCPPCGWRTAPGVFALTSSRSMAMRGSRRTSLHSPREAGGGSQR